MYHLVALRSLAIVVAGLLLIPQTAAAEEPLPPKGPARAALGDLFRLGEITQAAEDLKQAGQAFEQFGVSMEVVAASMAIMSSEFDPFGYKTAFRTIDRQAETIERQHEVIRELQQQEIDRLQRELHSARAKAPAPGNKRRKKASRQRGSSRAKVTTNARE
jgi:hypothetical protein